MLDHRSVVQFEALLGGFLPMAMESRHTLPSKKAAANHFPWIRVYA